MFDAEPPEEIEAEIAGDDDLGGQHALEDEFVREFGPEAAGGGRKKSKGDSKSRRDSVQPFAGLSKHLKDLINEGSEDGDDVKSRLEALEQSTLRIERMLGRLCEELDEGGRRVGTVDLGGESGTLKDLDKSGTSPIDDD